MNEQFTFNYGFKEEPIHTINFIKSRICEQENIVYLDKPNIENSDMLDLGDGHRITTSFSRLSIHSFFYSPFNKKCTIKALFDLLNNSFYSDESKFHIIRIYSKIKKVYNVFSKIARNIRWNKMKKFDNSFDLCMNDLCDYKKTTLIEIAEDNARYIFRISDMIKIFNNALTNNYEMFAEPQQVKNPYTNKELSTHNLYNIYYTIKYSTIVMPILLHLFFLSKFDLDDFLLNNEEKIRDMTIMSYIKNISKKKINKLIYEMFLQYPSCFRLKVDDDFPMDKINVIFLPFVKLYIQIKYTLSRVKKTRLTFILKNKLILFCKHAPLFGRKIIKITNNKKIFYFNSDCKTFDELKMNTFKRIELINFAYDTDEDSDSESQIENESEIESESQIENESEIESESESETNNDETNNDEMNNDETNNDENQPTQSIQQTSIMNVQYNSNIERYMSRQLFYNSNINHDSSIIQYYNDPISLYHHNNNDDNDIANNDNISENMEEELNDDEYEEEMRRFPYNYDSH